MGILKMITADLQDLTLFSSYGGTTISNTYKRTGTYSFLAGSCAIAIPPSVEGYIRFALLDTTSQRHNLNFENTTLSISRLAGTITYDTVVQYALFGGLYVWDIIEIYWKINNTVGAFKVRVNGVEYFNYIGDTYASGPISVSAITYVPQTIHAYLDDIIVRDDMWPGRGGIYVLRPNEGSLTEEWTPSAGNPEDCIDETPPSYTDYIYTSTASSGIKQLAGLSSFPANSGYLIRGVGVFTNQKTDLAAEAAVKTLILPSGAPAAIAGSGVGIDVSAAWNSTFYATNPYTAVDWTNQDINNLQIGIEATKI